MLLLSQLWQAKEECKAIALKSLDTSALKDRKAKWLYKMTLQLQLVTGLSWVGKHVVVLMQVNHYDSRFMEQFSHMDGSLHSSSCSFSNHIVDRKKKSTYQIGEML